MKILPAILLFLIFGISYSQSFIDGIIHCSKNWADQSLRFAVGEEILGKNFEFDKAKTIITVFNKNEDRLERLTVEEFKKSNYPATELSLYYKISDENLILKELFFPYNLNCTTPWDSEDIKEILEPYLKVLQKKAKVDLKKALEIGNGNRLNEIYFWDIDYEKRKLIWTLKSKLKNNQSKVIKINSKNGKIISEFIEIPID